MHIEIFEDDLTKQDCAHLPIRRGARAILKHKALFCLIYNKHWNLYTLPGGGIKTDETPPEALKREVLEETGFCIRTIKKTLILTEYFKDSVWEHHFFLCETTDNPIKPQLTSEEKAAGMTTVFKSLEDALDIFLNHESDRLHKDAIYQREFLGFIHSVE